MKFLFLRTQVNILRIYLSIDILLHCRINVVHQLDETQNFFENLFLHFGELISHTSIEIKKRGNFEVIVSGSY